MIGKYGTREAIIYDLAQCPTKLKGHRTIKSTCYKGVLLRNLAEKKLGAADSIVPFVSYRTKGTIESHMNED